MELTHNLLCTTAVCQKVLTVGSYSTTSNQYPIEVNNLSSLQLNIQAARGPKTQNDVAPVHSITASYSASIISLAVMITFLLTSCCCGWSGTALTVGWQLSGDLSAPDLPAIVPAVAVAAVVGEQNDDGVNEGVAAIDLGT
uniref:Uncharacterized protein n=1 Tax=Glossina palpalis gambiensis TaxID=67801 RepID=A0A1B0B251_9MUSC